MRERIYLKATHKFHVWQHSIMVFNKIKYSLRGQLAFSKVIKKMTSWKYRTQKPWVSVVLWPGRPCLWVGLLSHISNEFRSPQAAICLRHAGPFHLYIGPAMEMDT